MSVRCLQAERAAPEHYRDEDHAHAVDGACCCEEIDADVKVQRRNQHGHRCTDEPVQTEHIGAKLEEVSFADVGRFVHLECLTGCAVTPPAIGRGRQVTRLRIIIQVSGNCSEQHYRPDPRDLAFRVYFTMILNRVGENCQPVVIPHDVGRLSSQCGRVEYQSESLRR